MASIKSKSKGEFQAEIHDTIGIIKGDGEKGYGKCVLHISWGDHAPTVDIRNVKWEDGVIPEKGIMKGISLTNEEADILVDILLQGQYGSVEALEKSLKERKELFSLKKDMVNEIDENMFGPVKLKIEVPKDRRYE